MTGETEKKPKVSAQMLLSPGGLILFFFIIISEIIDFLIPSGTGIGDIAAIVIEIIIILYSIFILGVPLKSLFLPMIIERIPILSFLPSWLIWLLKFLFLG